MQTGTDMRIPIVLGAAPSPMDAVLVEDGKDMPAQGYAVRFTTTLPGHIAGCSCCTLRGPAADALGRMFRERATGNAPFFPRVVVLASPAGEQAIREALEQDVVTRARYKIQQQAE
jgi:hypothetical protein